MLEWVASPEAWVALATLTLLEIVLGIDNIIFISILSGRLPEEERERTRKTGLLLAMGMRIALLFTLSWIMKLDSKLFGLFGSDISGRDLILILGGLFLLAKSTMEIHHKLEGGHEEKASSKAVTVGAVLVQIALLDIVFSIDSVITAVGMAGDFLMVMILAVVISVVVMLVAVNAIADFVEKHPTFKMLALSFLLLIGFSLVAEGLEVHINKGFLYFAMGFSLFVEFLNLRFRSKQKPVQLHGPKVPPGPGGTATSEAS
jgi:predicted tellurium resistance membrane protein TerC